MLVFFSTFGYSQENLTKSDYYDNYINLLSLAYQADNKDKLLEVISEIESTYGNENHAEILSYYINLAQLYFRAEDNEKAIKVLESEPSVIKYFYLGTLKKRIEIEDHGQNDLERFKYEIMGNTNTSLESYDKSALVFVKILLGEEISDAIDSNDMLLIIAERSQEELLKSIWGQTISADE